MNAIRFIVCRMLRCVLAAALVFGAMESGSMAGGDNRHADMIIASPLATAHACCDPEPVANETCRIICAQSPCSLAGLPAALDPSASIDCSLSWRLSAVVFPEDLSPETGTPPPRS